MSHLPIALRVYLISVMLAALALLTAVTAVYGIVGPRWQVALIVFAFAIVAIRVPLRLDHKKKLTLEDAATIAAALLLIPSLAMLVTALATLTLRFDRSRWYERAFNAAKSATAVGIASVIYGTLTHDASHAPIDPVNGAIAAVAKYLTSVTLVDLAIAFQMGRPPATSWWRRRRPSLLPNLATHLFGLLGAVAGATQPWVLALLAVPSATIWAVARESASAQQRASALLHELADVAELRDAYGRGRSREAAALAERIARRLRLAADRIALVRDAARLQHIGALDLPGNYVPSVSGMDGHAEMGERRLRKVDVLAELASIVGMHHEHIDGTGPRGRRAAEIPLEASIVGIADEYVRLARPTAEREALPTAEIVRSIQDSAGRWPTAVVEALVAEVAPADYPATRVSVAAVT